MKKVLMVCLGNICRSPLAEGILKSKVDGSKVFVDSAGTEGWHQGNPPDQRSIDVAKYHHIDIANQRSRKFKASDFNEFDLILVMDKTNYIDIASKAESESDRQKIKLILDFSPNTYSEVPDPYYDGKNGFEFVYQLLDEACEIILSKI